MIGVSGSSARNSTEQITRAVEYWNNTDDSDIDWRPAFVVRPNAVSPDVEIRFVDTIQSCGVGISDNTIGCARVLSAASHPTEPEVVRINKGLTNESTYRTIRHELGHVLGLEHGEGPEDVMAPYDEVYSQIIRVRIEFETTAKHEQGNTRRQIRYALDYYAEGADGHVEEDIEFAVIDESSVTDIVIEVNREGGESRISSKNHQILIEVNGIPIDKRGWHVGYWLGFYFGASSVDELPPPFDNPRTDPRVGWWH